MKKPNKISAVFAVTLACALTLVGCSATPAPSASPAADNSPNTITKGVLRIGTVTDNKPYSYIANGKNAGLDIDLMTEFAKRQHLKTEFVQIEFSSLIPAVASKQIDVAAASISNTEERRKVVDFSDPYMIGPIAVLSKKGSGITKDTSSLAGIRLGLIQGTIQDGYATDHDFKANIVRFPDNNTGVAALKTGSIDGFFMDAPLASDYAAADDNLEIPIVIYDNQAPYGIAFNKENPGLKSAFDKVLKDLIADGTLEKMQVKNLPGLPVNDVFKPKE